MAKKQRFGSTIGWLNQLEKRNDDHESIVQKLSSQMMKESSLGCHNNNNNNSESDDHDDDADDDDRNRDDGNRDPVNILVFEGGGLKGHAHLGMLEGLVEESGGEDIGRYFDMVGGTSIGGIAALLLSKCGSIDDFLPEGRKVLEAARVRTFMKLNWFQLLFKGALTDEKSSIASVVQELYQDTPLYNPSVINAFALCTVKNATDVETPPGETFEPFLARTYDVDPQSQNHVYPGSSDLLLWEAMAATSAAPVLADRVELEINGEKKRFGDGGLIANNPAVLALLEARNLWPNRPIGVVLVLGLDDCDTQVVKRAFDVAKKEYPDMSFVRLSPNITVDAFLETRPEKLRQAEVDAKNFIKESKEAFDVLNKLKASGFRRKHKNAPERQSRRRNGRRLSAFLTSIRPSFIQRQSFNETKPRRRIFASTVFQERGTGGKKETPRLSVFEKDLVGVGS